MKLIVDKRFLSEMRGRYEGHALRVGIIRNQRYQAPAPKTDGLTSVLGGPARKTQKSRLKEINSELAKMREKSASIRSKAKAIRAKALALRASGKTSAAKHQRLAAKKQSGKVKDIQAKSRALRLSKVKPQKATLTLRDVVKRAQRATGINFLRLPFVKARSPAYRKFIDAYMRAASKNKSMVKVERLLLEVVTTPILKKRYGRNSPGTKATKGFNRRFIDTGQMIKGLSSQIKRKRRNV